MAGKYTRVQARTLIGLSVAMGGSLTVMASFNFILTPMLADLNLTLDEARWALALPSTAALLIVFLAGRWGDKRGHRTVISWMSLLFILGCALVLITQGLPLLTLGLLFEGVAAMAIQIVVFGLLSDQFTEPKLRAIAFGTFGMVSPFIWMVFPVVAGAVVDATTWRLVAALWVVAGVAMFLSARFLLPRPAVKGKVGEIWTPLLAGLSLVLVVQGLSRASDVGWGSLEVWIPTLVGVGLAVLCVQLVKRLTNPNFSLLPLRLKPARLLLFVVIIIPLINTVFLMTMAFQYVYGLSVMETALIMVPAQLGAVLGTRLIAAPLARKYGTTKTAAWLFLALAFAMLTAFFMTPESPVWVPMTYVALYNILTVAASITVTNALMAHAPAEDSGRFSAYRGSGVSLGQVLAVVLMDVFLGVVGGWLLVDNLESNGMSGSQAATELQDIASDATSPTVMTDFPMALSSGETVDQVLAGTFTQVLHLNGLLGAVLAILSMVLVIRAGRSRTTPAHGSGDTAPTVQESQG